jgi:hypothetical protein
LKSKYSIPETPSSVTFTTLISPGILTGMFVLSSGQKHFDGLPGYASSSLKHVPSWPEVLQEKQIA